MTSSARLLVILTLASSCDGRATLAQREPDEYVGCATDESWPLFDEVADLTDDSASPLVLSPGYGATVSALPVDITWQDTPTTVGRPIGDVPAVCPQWSQGYTTLHLPQISGTVYDMQIVQGGKVVHRVLTTLQRWTASAETWKRLAGSTVTLVFHRIVVAANAREEGPYAATTPWQLTIAE